MISRIANLAMRRKHFTRPVSVPTSVPGRKIRLGLQRPATTTPAAEPAPPPPPQMPTTPLSRFGPGQSLRGIQINPFESERLKNIQGLVGGAAEAVGQGPDLGQAAAERLNLFREQVLDPQFEIASRDVGRRAAALGRVGSGVVTTELGELGARRERELGQEARRLSAETAFQEEQNRLRRLGALGGLESQLYGQEAGARGELRGERGYQEGLAQQALQNRIRQLLLGEDIREREFGRGMQRAGLAAQLGYGGTPTGLEYNLANMLQRQAGESFAGAGDILSLLRRRRQGQPPLVSQGQEYRGPPPA